VSRLILVNTFAHFPRRWLIRSAALLSRLAPPRPSPKWTLRMRERFFFSDDVSREIRDEWWNQVDKVPLRAYSYRLPLIAGVDLRPRLAEVNVPAVVLVAPDDRVVPPAAGLALAKLLPKTVQLIEKRTSHGALVHPEVDVAEIIRANGFGRG
jgi:pimeloyl-ACP methyl ester carboxylesterase